MKKYFKDNIGVILVVVLAIIPILIWVFMKPLSARFISSGATFRSLGQVTGLLGMALLSINFILSARFKFLDKWFNGLNRVYLKHHIIGALSFCLLLFHPTFLTIQFIFISLKISFDFIFAFGSWPLFFGKLALLIFVALMVITFYLNFKYQHWKNTHKYLGAVLFLGGLHMLFIPSDISNNILLKSYMVVLACLGAYSYAYRTILGVYKKQEYSYVVKETIKINENVIEIKLAPLGQKLNFLPGQFVFIRFDMGGALSESHPFSIASASESGEISLGIKVLGDYTNEIYKIKSGTACQLEGPFGAFSYQKAALKEQVWIAGGIGIAPFLSMAREISVSGSGDYKIDLFYSIKNTSEAAFGSELSAIAKENNNFKYHEHFSEKEGYISADLISQKIGNSKDAEIFLCGPTAFMKSLRDQFVKLGVSNNRIHSEEFSLN